MKHFWVLGLFSLIFSANLTARAETFLLTQGGQIVGELLNPQEIPRQTYQIKTEQGVAVTLQRAQVKEVVRRRPAEIEYERVRPRYPDTVEGQWTLAEWCRERSLLTERKAHLERILELDPSHVKARHALGYSQLGGKWTTQQQSMESQGYEMYKGKYRSKQEIQLMQEKDKQEDSEREWTQKIDRWLIWLRGDRARVAQENIQDIRDPAALKPILAAMRSSPNWHVRVLFVQALAKIGTPEAQRAMAYFAVHDEVEEVRLSCLDYLKKKKDPSVVDYLIGRLKDKDNRLVNRAAVGLKEMGDMTAVGPLIDAVVTTHKFKVSPANPGQYNVGFGAGPGGSPGGSSFGFGGNRPTIVSQPIPNRAVLDTLEQLTGVNYGFDVKAWRSWYALQKRRETADSRGG